MNKFFGFSVSLLGTSSFAFASIPFGIESATAQEAKTTQGTAAAAIWDWDMQIIIISPLEKDEKKV